jgi:hypothetical protein
MSKKYLVYSSIGDRTRFPEFWLNEPEKRNFDLWVTYYGERDDAPHRSNVDRYFKAHGGKFQNFYKIHEAHREEILEYDAVFIVDDDIEIGTEDINRLFDIRQSYDLWILQPAFEPHSRISHDVTARIPGALLHFTNLVEMCVPMFSRQALTRFMDRFDPELVSWGTDYFYIWVNGINFRNRYAVVDAVTCVNPDPPPGLPREITRLGTDEKLVANFRQVARRHGVREWATCTHAVLFASTPGRAFTASDNYPRLHEYPARIRRVAVIRSIDGRHECCVSGEPEKFALNDSALAILGLCDGRTSACMMIMQLKNAFDLSTDEMSALRASVERTLREFVDLGLIRAYSAPHYASELAVAQPQGPEPRVCLAVEESPCSIQVINLDRRRDRWLSLSTDLAHAGAPEVRRLSAIDANDYLTIDAMLEAHDDRLHPDYLDINGFDGSNRRFRAKTACALSHRTALRNILMSGDAGWHIVLEDDNHTFHDWAGLLDSFADTLYAHAVKPDMILLGNRVGIASPLTGIHDRYGTDAYAVHSSVCERIIESIRFADSAFHIDYSLDNHYHALCASGVLDIALLENGPWINNFGTGYDSDIENPRQGDRID